MTEPVPLRSIVEEFQCSAECPICRGAGMVSEEYPECRCGPDDDCCGVFMPCPSIAVQREVMGGG